MVWTIILNVIVDVWIVSNLIYFRANGVFLSFSAIQMASNLQGFEGSIWAYWNWKSTIFIVLTIIYSILIIPIEVKSRLIKPFVFALVLAILLEGISVMCRYHIATVELAQEGREEENVNIVKNLGIPIVSLVSEVNSHQAWMGDWEVVLDNRYVYEHSIISLFPAIGVVKLSGMNIARKRNVEVNKNVVLVETISYNELSEFLGKGSNGDKKPRLSLIFLLVESLESWVIDVTDDKGQLIAPNLNRLVNNKANLYCSKVISQVKEGVSGDGQMICNTGLLPISKGSASILYGDNIFPNWAHFFEESLIIDIGGNIWNQEAVNVSYNYSGRVNPSNEEGVCEDKELLDALTNELNRLDTITFCAQVITVSTHTPFLSHQCKDLYFRTDIPKTLKNYLHCVHYTDSCIGSVISAIEELNMSNCALVITGDHTIYKQSLLREMRVYAEQHNWDIKSGKNYVPLIIYTPQQKEKMRIDDECYQMDIYPTILHLIGCEDYYWKGFGVNLLDSAARHHRPCTEEEAYQLSDKLIRSNWFKTNNKEVR